MFNKFFFFGCTNRVNPIRQSTGWNDVFPSCSKMNYGTTKNTIGIFKIHWELYASSPSSPQQYFRWLWRLVMNEVKRSTTTAIADAPLMHAVLIKSSSLQCISLHFARKRYKYYFWFKTIKMCTTYTAHRTRGNVSWRHGRILYCFAQNLANYKIPNVMNNLHFFLLRRRLSFVSNPCRTRRRLVTEEQ